MNEPTLLITIDDSEYADIRQSIDAICSEFPSSYWRGLEDSADNERYPEKFVATLEEAGFMSPSIPEEHEGIGLPIGGVAEIAKGIHACGSNAATFVAQNALVEVLVRHAGEAQKAPLLPRLASGELRLQSAAFSEPGAGDDASSWETVAEKKADGYVINGRKRWVYFAEDTNLILLGAKTGKGADEVSLFAIDLAAAGDSGLDISPIKAMNNNCGAEVLFNGLHIGEECLVGEAGQGLVYLDTYRTVECILMGAAAVGDCEFFSKKGTDYANERVVFGNPIGKYQGIQFPLARTYIESQGAGMLLQMAVAHYEAGSGALDEAVMARYMAVQAAWDSADTTFSTHGGFAFAREYDVERKWREARAWRNASGGDLPHIATRTLDLHQG